MNISACTVALSSRVLRVVKFTRFLLPKVTAMIRLQSILVLGEYAGLEAELTVVRSLPDIPTLGRHLRWGLVAELRALGSFYGKTRVTVTP